AGYGNLASGGVSLATGSNTTASGDFSASFGEMTVAQSYGSLVLGRWNVVSGTPTGWTGSDPVLVVGNGTSGARSNALTLLQNGNLSTAGTMSWNGTANGDIAGNASTATTAVNASTATTAGNVTGTVAVAHGGTGATDVAGARSALLAATRGANS